MTLKFLFDNPPWDWPENAAEILLAALDDGALNAEERLGAVELASELSVINDELALALLSILRDATKDEELRAAAAISLGPALEYAAEEDIGDPDNVLISEPATQQLQEGLRACYLDTGLPSLVRRRCLEASVRAPRDWHPEALRAAFISEDQQWRLTAVFAMSWIDGFETQILETLQSDNEELRAQALYAAGRWEIDEAWAMVAELVKNESTPKELLLAAIDAAASIRPPEAVELLGKLTSSEDEEIADAAEEAIAMAEDLQLLFDEEQDESIIVQ